ncbi:MAG: hypothetical protein RL487_521 [Actinomycetota bacterium]
MLTRRANGHAGTVPAVRRSLSVAVVAMLLSACGSSGSATDSTGAGGKEPGTVNPEYADFCLTAQQLNAESTATHGNDPTAMSDPEAMKKAWSTIIASSRKLFDEAPLQVKSDVKAMLDGMMAMDAIYADYKYNLAEMKAVPEVAESLDKIANDAVIAQASARFRSFMSDNCGI